MQLKLINGEDLVDMDIAMDTTMAMAMAIVMDMGIATVIKKIRKYFLNTKKFINFE